MSDSNGTNERPCPKLRLPAAAELLGVSPATLRRMRERGEGPPHFLVGKQPVYVEAEVIVWLQAQRVAD